MEKERQRGVLQFLSKHQKGQRRKLLWKVLQGWPVSMVLQDKNEPLCLRANKPYESRPLQS
jgi:hypothetical protein